MIPGLDLLAIPLGWLLWLIYTVVSNYFVAIFLFTLLVRAATFPLSLKSQKAQADRARLAPRLERLQKKYAKDPKKLQAKQMELYEKEGVSLTGGCLPMVIQMVVLFGIIAVIYSPLSYLARIPAEVLNASVTAVTQTEENPDPVKVPSKEMTGYYKELRFLLSLDNEQNVADVRQAITALDDDAREGKTADEYLEKMMHIRKDFSFFNKTLLENPWDNDKGIKGISILWLIPLLSWLTALGSSLVSMRYTNMAAGGQKQPGQGCTNVMLIALMPLFSLYITFIVPGGVGIYWICSNLIAIAQTIVMNMIYNPAKIRAQAEKEYEERRQRRVEDKKRLAEARAREEAELRRQEAEEKRLAQEKREAANAPKPTAASKNPNKRKRRAENGNSAENPAERNTAETAGDPARETPEEEQPGRAESAPPAVQDSESDTKEK